MKSLSMAEKNSVLIGGHLSSAYIISTGAYLPGEPIPSEDIELYLGQVNGKRCPLRNRVLKSNGILTRHYALNTKQEVTHSVEELATHAARQSMERAGLEPSDVTMLATATSQGDLALPGLASMVHAQLELPECEIISAHGVCSSGMMALKGALNAVRLGEHQRAMVCAAEQPSRQLRASRYEASLAREGSPRFEADAAFLRWMLSDGAGAALVSSTPARRGLSLRVEWLRLRSFAHALPVCMYAGRSPREGALNSWLDYPTYAEAEADGAMLLRQDTRLLDHIVKLGVQELLEAIKLGMIDVKEIDHFLCHYSSHYFKGPIADLLELSGAMIPEERWFSNLYSKGNTGCASIFIMLDEVLQSGRLKAGETILCAVPESGRFSIALAKMTVVDGEDR